MTQEKFEMIFDNEIMPFIQEIQDNNPRIKMKNMVLCKRDIFREYCKLNETFKEVVFSKDSLNLLDRHKVASCICGAFLRVSVFNKQELINEIKESREKIEALFFYVNELVAFHAGCKFLSFFMVNEIDKMYHDKEKSRHIIENFPVFPPVRKATRGCYSNILFYLSRIKDDEEIGLEHYDKYSYSMYFYMLEEYYYKTTKQ